MSAPSHATNRSTKALPQSQAFGQRLTALWESEWFVPLMAVLASGIIFALTLQTHVNGSYHRYATDVGNIQNALPRWGHIHFTGYPLYLITGSSLVSLLRLFGFSPATAASLLSLLWGALTAGVVVLLARHLGARRLPALLGALLFSVSTSMWIDGSLAEVHTMSMLLTSLILLFAFRFNDSGEPRELLCLGLFLANGVLHGRALVGLLPAVALIVAPQWRVIVKKLPLLVAIGLGSFLLYLYLPLREWMGATWTFGETTTWQGFWQMVFNPKNARDAAIPLDPAELWIRAQIVFQVLNDDLPFLFIGLGLGGLMTLKPQNDNRLDWWRQIAGLHLAWLPFAGVIVIIYAGFIGDAILAVKLPVSMLAGLGLALLATFLWSKRAEWGYLAVGMLIAFIGIAAWRNYPAVIAITQDRGVEAQIAIVDQAAAPSSPTVVMIPWGHDYWGAAYAQAYRGQLEGVNLVDHNAPLDQYLAEGDRLLTLSQTFFVFPADWWQGVLGEFHLSTYAPGLIEISTAPVIGPIVNDAFVVNDDLIVHHAQLNVDGNAYTLRVDWQARQKPQRDYSIAVHLLSTDPPTGPQDLLAQADQSHPVEGWSPVSGWLEGQIVRDVYRLEAPPGSEPAAIRVTAYYLDENGEFINGEWLTLAAEP
ncbi:MAG: DUF2723 domain-containing protein [Chloroflexi bacterium]|nr:DUF2723 domain-containing protein [Chloroflexota bacterium]